MAAMGQPSLASFQQGADGNFNPTIQDWVTAYKPVDKALNKVFETRITNANARQVQFNLAVVRSCPLQQPSSVNLSCMVSSRRLAVGIILSWPRQEEHQHQSNVGLAVAHGCKPRQPCPRASGWPPALPWLIGSQTALRCATGRKSEHEVHIIRQSCWRAWTCWRDHLVTDVFNA